MSTLKSIALFFLLVLLFALIYGLCDVIWGDGIVPVWFGVICLLVVFAIAPFVMCVSIIFGDKHSFP